ncbi:MAG: hypothetical protein MUO31_10320, partial [Thermodesulfovibrionales bacterium]|nr:hypothetical protein [Thermodesulfovibrionales bacterium]
VALGIHGQLEGKTRGVGSQDGEMLVLHEQALVGFVFVLDDVAENAALFQLEVGSGAVDLLLDAQRHHRLWFAWLDIAAK